MEIVVGILVVGVLVLAAALVVIIRRLGVGQQVVSEAAKAEFQALSQDALANASEQFLTLAEQRFARQREAGTQELDTKKQLIDQ